MATPNHTWVESIGLRTLQSPSGLRARWRFAKTALAATVSVPRPLRAEVHARVIEHLWRCGVRQVPLIALLGLALGLLIVGQSVALLRQVGAQHYMGTVMVTVVMRELGPLLTAFLLAARAGTAMVVELGALRVTGKVDRAERVGLRTMRELVVPRLKAMAVATVCLTVYLIGIALTTGYVVAFLQGVPLRPGGYARQLADALHGLDFALVGLKAALFGAVVAVVCCYHGLERLLRIEEFSQATTRAVVESLACCLVLDAVFLVGYLMR